MRRLILIAALLFTPTSTLQADYFKDDGYAAAKQALEDKQNLVIILTGERCSPCAQLKRVVEAANKAGLIKGFHLAVVDIRSELGQKLDQKGVIPQIHRYSNVDGEWKHKVVLGYLNQSKFLEFCRGKN